MALHDNWPLIQITELTGVAGLSFIVAFVNVIVLTTAYRLVVEARTRVMRPHFDFTFTMAAIVGILIFGLRATQISPSTKPIRVAAVQSNVPKSKVGSAIHQENLRSIPAVERNRAPLKSPT